MYRNYITDMDIILLVSIMSVGVSSNIDHLQLVMPRYVPKNGDVILKCEHSVTPDQLYKVEWQKDGKKIFQYIKGRKPPFLNYKTAGAHFNKTYSNQKQLQLSKLDYEASGFYTCVVSMETPIFSQDSERRELTVISPQVGDPTIRFSKDTYKFGEVLRVNCTTSPSRPAAYITWLINGERVNDSWTQSYPYNSVPGHSYWDREVPSIKQLSFEIKQLHIDTDNGRLTLTCLATIPAYVNPGEEYADWRNTTAYIDIEMDKIPAEAMSKSSVPQSNSNYIHNPTTITPYLLIIWLCNLLMNIILSM